jgi:TonB family protein
MIDPAGVNKMLKFIGALPFSLVCLLVFAVVPAFSQAPLLKASNTETDRDRDGLAGPVRRVRTEMSRLSTKTGKVVEGQRQLLETVAYDIKGTKTENAYYPVSSATLTGKEVYKYDDKGNISEMTLLNADGSILSKEVYTYEFDFVGNWTKMTTSVAVIENGKLSFDPTETTYRLISYYLDEAMMAKMQNPQPAQQQAPATAVNSSTNAANTNPVVSPKGSNSFVAGSQPANPQVKTPASDPKPKAVAPPLANASNSQEKPNVSALQNGNTTIASNSAMNAAAKTDSEPPPAPVANNPSPKPLLRPVSGGVLNGKAVSLPKPLYPDTARNARAQGTVVVEVVIDTNGKVISAKAVSGPGLLAQAAIQAAYQAKFSATTLSGQPVRVTGTINYTFTLAP